MISTGFKALDAAIGGLKKGKLYGLVTFNFDHVAAEYFALNMIANLHAPAFFHSSIKAPERWADAALAGERFFRFTNDDDEWDEEYSMPDFPCRQLFFNHKPAESAEDVCEKFESEYGNCPFELAFIDIKGMTARDRKQFETPQQEADHIIGMFQKLAGNYQIPVILIRCYHDLQAKFPGEKLEPDGYSRSFVETVENIIVLSKVSHRINIGLKRIDYDLDLSIFRHLLKQQRLALSSYAVSDIFPSWGNYSHEKIKSLKREIKKKMALAMAELQRIQNPITLFREMKFGEIGFAPTGSHPENLTEQINQSFTILMSCYAAEKYFPEAENFRFSFGNTRGRDMVVRDSEGNPVAEVEIFTAVRADNNRKLRKDVDRLRDAEIAAGCRRMVCYSAWNEYRLISMPGDEKVEVKFCPLKEFFDWIRE